MEQEKNTTPGVTSTETTNTETTPTVAPVVAEAPVAATPEVTAAPAVEAIQIPVKKLKVYGTAALIGVVLIAGAWLFKNGYIVAATVNGSPISRLAVIQELEKQAGKTTLEGMINKKLIKAEVEKSGVMLDAGALDARMKQIEAQVVAQGGTLDDALASEGITKDELTDQIATQLKIEKILADKLTVSDEEINKFIEDNKITPKPGMDLDTLKKSVADQLKQQKFQTEAQKWIADITAKAAITHYVNY